MPATTRRRTRSCSRPCCRRAAARRSSPASSTSSPTRSSTATRCCRAGPAATSRRTSATTPGPSPGSSSGRPPGWKPRCTPPPTVRDHEIDFGATLSPIALRHLFDHSAVHLNVEWRDLPAGRLAPQSPDHPGPGSARRRNGLDAQPRSLDARRGPGQRRRLPDIPVPVLERLLSGHHRRLEDPRHRRGPRGQGNGPRPHARGHDVGVPHGGLRPPGRRRRMGSRPRHRRRHRHRAWHFNRKRYGSGRPEVDLSPPPPCFRH